MPIRSPGYNLPSFQPTGNEQVDRALSAWVTDFGAQYTRNLYEAEQLPIAYSLQVTTGSALTTAYQTAGTLQIGLQGNESLLAIQTVRFRTTGAAGIHAIQVTFPNGDIRDMSTGTGGMQPIHVPETTGNRIFTVTGQWEVPTRIQAGGLHKINPIVRASIGDTGLTTGSIVEDGLLTVFVF